MFGIFCFDYLGRRIAKKVFQLETSNLEPETWRLVKDLRFVYDGWNMIAELDHSFATGPGLTGSRVNRTFLWGEDLSGTMTGAGGVGGLLSTTYQGTTYHVCSDANGNVTGLVPTSGPQAGQLIARYDYDPFGNRITNTGPDVDLCPFGFSSKYTDSETGLVYFGYRYYSPELGRWPSRDPIEEQGGINLYGMVGNDPVNQVDYLGLLRERERVKIKCGGVFGLFAKDAGVVQVIQYAGGSGSITPLNGPDSGQSMLATYVSLRLNFVPLSNSCCCQGGKYRWYQTITNDTEPGAPRTPRADTGGSGAKNLAPSYELTFFDQPYIKTSNLQGLWTQRGGRNTRVEVEFKLELQCEKGSSIKTLKTFKWGFWAELDKNGIGRWGLK